MKKIIDFIIKEKRILNADMFLLVLYSPELPHIKAGQFVNVKVDGEPSTFLRRPISVHNVDEDKGLLYLLIKIAGKGTMQLSKLQKGEKLNIILPLGNGFTLNNGMNSKRVLLVGGGVGTAPLLYLGKVLRSQGCELTFLLGARTQNDLLQLSDFAHYGRIFLTTEDGSAGEKGFVTQHSVLQHEVFDRIAACGPKPMMMAVAAYAAAHGIECEASLENLMACGLGACLCCVEKTDEGNVCVCKDGPVFNVKRLQWQNSK